MVRSFLVVAGVLVLSGPASAAYTPKLLVTTSGTRTTILYEQAATDPAASVLAFAAPIGTTATLTQPKGTVVGTFSGRATVADLGGETTAVSGTIEVADATTQVITSRGVLPLRDTAETCTGDAEHSAYWLMNYTVAGRTIPYPAYVDRIDPASPYARVAAFTLMTCLSNPDLPVGTPGRTTSGVKVLQTLTTFDGVFTAPAGESRWRLFGLPFRPGATSGNSADWVETQSLVRIPAAVTLAAKKSAKRKAVVSGKLTEGGKPVAGETVEVKAGSAVVATMTTNAAGTFKGTVKLPSAWATLTATATVAARDLGPAGCAPAFAIFPCVGATVAGFTATSRPVKITAK